jgi:hypothetical protein
MPRGLPRISFHSIRATLADDEDFEGGALPRMAFGDAIISCFTGQASASMKMEIILVD